MILQIVKEVEAKNHFWYVDKCHRFCYFNHFVKFHNVTPNNKGTRGQKPFFCTLGAGTDNSNGVNFEHRRKLLLLWISAVSFRGTA